MKKNRLIKMVTLVIMCVIGCSLFQGNNANAREKVIKAEEFLDTYKPNVVLEYEGNGKWSEVNESSDEKGYEEIDMDALKYLGEDENGPVYKQMLPLPIIGARAYYDQWVKLLK